MAVTKQEAEKKAREIVSSWTGAAVLTGWIPGSVFFLTGADLVMARQVADAFGVGVFDENALAQHLGTVVASGVAGGVIAEGVGWVPLVGWAVKSAMMGVKARVIGDATIGFFRARSPLADGPGS